jgi:hypothetical protein
MGFSAFSTLESFSNEFSTLESFSNEVKITGIIEVKITGVIIGVIIDGIECLPILHVC